MQIVDGFVCRCTSRTGLSQTARECGGTYKARLRCLRRCCTQRQCQRRSQPVCQCAWCLRETKLVAHFPTQWFHFWTPGLKACSLSTPSLASSPLSPVLTGQLAFQTFSFNLCYFLHLLKTQSRPTMRCYLTRTKLVLKT